MSKKSVEKIVSYLCADIDTSELEETEATNWLSRSQCGTVHTVKGVPSSELDVLIVPPQNGLTRVVDLCKKTGKYGGIKDRITVHNVPLHQTRNLSCVTVWFELSGSVAIVHVGEYKFKFGRYRTELDASSNLENIVRWHFSRYYKFLSECDVMAVEGEFRSIVEASSMTLAEANRLASRLLYKAARNCGYRKLTQREQQKLNLSGQWHTESEYAAAHYNIVTLSEYSPTGAGEFSLTSSRGIR